MANASKDDHQKICGYLSYIISGAKVSIEKSIPEIQYSWMSEEFKYIYKKLIEAPTNEKIKYYNEFTKIFGQGVVTQIDLTSGAYGKFEIVSDNSAESREYSLSGSVGISSPDGGGSVSSMIGWKNKNAEKNSSLSVIADWYPSTSPAQEWAIAVFNLAKEQGISILTDSAKLNSLPTPKEVKAPEFPKYEKPDSNDQDNKIPKSDSKYKPSEEENSKDIKDALQEMKDNFSVQNFVNESNEIVESRKRSKSLNIDPRNSFNEILMLEDDDSYPIEVSSIGGTLKSSFNSELGDYIPCGFKITPWEEIFPELKLSMEPTLTAIYIAKVNIFYYTRLQFGQYLQFLSQLPFSVTQQKNLDVEVSFYFLTCDKFLEQVTKDMYDTPFDEKKYNMTIASFDEYLTRLEETGDFTNRNIYKIFFENYKFFEDNAYGIIPYLDSFEYHYQINTSLYPIEIVDGYRDMGSFLDAGIHNKTKKVLEEAVRLYPVINKDGSIYLAFYSRGSWETSLKVMNFIQFDMNNSSFGIKLPEFKYNSINKMMNVINIGIKSQKVGLVQFFFSIKQELGETVCNINFKSVGHKDIPKDGTFNVRGIAMFEDFPFDSVLSILK
jgi:hypothetical protein